jgi:hypothetical protein
MKTEEEAALRARALAKEYLAHVLSCAVDTMAVPTRDDYLAIKREFDEASAEDKSLLRSFARCSAGPDQYARARRGDWDTHVHLCRAAVVLAAYAEPLPRMLQEYMIVDAPTFKQRRGRRTGGDRPNTDTAIAATVALLVNSGIKRTRNRHRRTNRLTACLMVVEILRELGITRTEAAVEEICRKYRHVRFVFSRPGVEELELWLAARKRWATKGRPPTIEWLPRIRRP